MTAADPQPLVDLDDVRAAAAVLDDAGYPDATINVLTAVTELSRSRRQIAAIRALHVERPNTRCGAYRHSSSGTVPGAPAPPLWCALTEGHDGEHVASDRRGAFEPNGWHDHLPGTCERCNVPAPCPTVRALEEPSE